MISSNNVAIDNTKNTNITNGTIKKRKSKLSSINGSSQKINSSSHSINNKSKELNDHEETEYNKESLG